MKIIAVNAGSSSLKFQLLDMPEERIMVTGVVERIGLKDSIFSMKIDGESKKDIQKIPTHTEAVDLLLKRLVEYGIVESLNEIEGVGHRVVHGGEAGGAQ